MTKRRELGEQLRWGLGLFVLVALARFAFGVGRNAYTAFPDEPAQLAMGRWLSGGTPWSLFDHPTWQPGFAILLVPVYWLTEDPESILRIALVINCVIGGVGAVLLARLIRTLTLVGDSSAHVIALVIALMPASLAASMQVWAEPLITVIVLGGLHLAIRALDRGSVLHGVAGLFVAAAGYLCHGRLLPMLPFALVVLSLVLVRRRQWVAVGASVVLASIIFGAAVVFTRWVHSNVWIEPDDTNTVGSTLKRLGNPGALFDSVVGQVWYVLLASAMFAGFGFWMLVRVALRGSGDSVMRRRSDSIIVLGLVVPLVGVSMLFMSGRVRPDHLIYGRYNEAILWPVVAIGAVWLLDVLSSKGWVGALKPLATALTVSAMLTLVVGIRSGEALQDGPPTYLMISGVAAALGRESVVVPWLVFVVYACASAVVVLALASRTKFALVTALAIGAVLSGFAVRTWVVLGGGKSPIERAAVVREVDEIVPPGETLGYRFVPIDEPSLVFLYRQREMAQAFQMYLPDHRFEVDEGLDDDIGPYVFAPKAHQPLVAAGAEMLWLDERSGMALWLEPTSP